MDIKTRSELKQELLTLSFMRSKTKPAPKVPKKASLIDMTREEFKTRLNQHKQQEAELIH